MANYLKQNHGDKYWVLNVSERLTYNPSVFGNRVTSYHWPDHWAPPILYLFQICEQAVQWLQSKFSFKSTCVCRGPVKCTSGALQCWQRPHRHQPLCHNAVCGPVWEARRLCPPFQLEAFQTRIGWCIAALPSPLSLLLRLRSQTEIVLANTENSQNNQNHGTSTEQIMLNHRNHRIGHFWNAKNNKIPAKNSTKRLSNSFRNWAERWICNFGQKRQKNVIQSPI